MHKDIGSRCCQKYIFLTHNCKMGTKNANFEIIDQHMNVTCHSFWTMTSTFPPLVLCNMFVTYWILICHDIFVVIINDGMVYTFKIGINNGINMLHWKSNHVHIFFENIWLNIKLTHERHREKNWEKL
jgi:hypothetical protein